MIACCKEYLEESANDSIFVVLDIFGPEFVTSVMGVETIIVGNVE